MSESGWMWGATRRVRRLAAAGMAAVALGALVTVAGAPGEASAQVVPESAESTVSAVGTAQIEPSGSATLQGSLGMSIEERTSDDDDILGAVNAVETRIDEISAALIAAGVSESDIQVQSFNVSPDYSYPVPVDQPMPVEPMETPATRPGQPDVQGYLVNAQVQVNTDSPEQLANAMRIAIENGATNVYSYSQGMPLGPTPDSSALAPAVAEAAAQARTLAQASAQASGVTLGTIHSVTVLPITPFYGPMPNPVWQVQVQVTYNIQ
ncbi:MAG: SIMPL domain-containing protein [Dehalococcoidia bacterium]